MYLDDKGLIVQKDEDAGDCLQREGFWYEAMFLNNTTFIPAGLASYRKALDVLSTPSGLVRSWKPGTSTPPWNDPKDTSRDQLVSNIRACGYFRYNDKLQEVLQNVVKNFSRFPNGDIAFIQDYARFARSFYSWWLYPVCLVGDIIMIMNTLIRCWKGRNFDDVGDDINHIGDLAQAQNILPTPFSWLARKLYVWFRPCFEATGVIDPSTQIPEIVKDQGLGAVWALTWYFRPASKANPEFIDAWIPVVKRF